MPYKSPFPTQGDGIGLTKPTPARPARRAGTDNEAVELGFTVHMIAESDDLSSGFAWIVRPDAELDDIVQVFDTDNQEWIRLNGWNWSFEPAE